MEGDLRGDGKVIADCRAHCYATDCPVDINRLGHGRHGRGDRRRSRRMDGKYWVPVWLVGGYGIGVHGFPLMQPVWAPRLAPPLGEAVVRWHRCVVAILCHWERRWSPRDQPPHLTQFLSPPRAIIRCRGVGGWMIRRSCGPGGRSMIRPRCRSIKVSKTAAMLVRHNRARR